MKVKLILADLTTGNTPEQRKSDRRYKIGFRVIRNSTMTFNLKLKLSNPHGYFALGDTITTQFGLFRVVMVNNMVIEGEMQLISVFAFTEGNRFAFEPEMEVHLTARNIGEGSAR